MLKERTAVRLDEETRVKLERFIKQRKTTLSDVIREAINEYLKEKELTWAKIDYEIVPFIYSKFLEKGFKLIDVIKPSASVEKLIAKKLPIVLCFEYNSQRVDVKLTFEELNDKHAVTLEIPLIYTVQYDDYIETSQGSIIHGYIDKIHSDTFEALLVDAINELIEYFNTGKIEAREKLAKKRYELQYKRG